MSLISREDAINYLMTNTNWHDEDGYTVEDADEKRAIITDLINGVPDADYGWTPVEERLPEDNTYVLTTIHIPGRQPKVRSGHFKYGMYMNDNGDVWYEKSKEVLAWMPLPPAFKPKEDK